MISGIIAAIAAIWGGLKTVLDIAATIITAIVQFLVNKLPAVIGLIIAALALWYLLGLIG